MKFPQKKEDNEAFIWSVVIVFVSCLSVQSKIHLDKINDLQLQLVNDDLKTNLEVAQKLVAEMENYVSIYPDSTTMPDYYMQLGDLYTHALQLPVKGLYFFKKFMLIFQIMKSCCGTFLSRICVKKLLGQEEQAKAVYEYFLITYPQHELSKQ